MARIVCVNQLTPEIRLPSKKASKFSRNNRRVKPELSQGQKKECINRAVTGMYPGLMI